MVGSARVTAVAVGAAVCVVLVGCGSAEEQGPGPDPAATSAQGADEPSRGTPSEPPEKWRVEVVATDLESPWGLDFLPDGRAVVTSRDTAAVLLVDAAGTVTPLTGPGARHLQDVTVRGGEGGLLGVAVSPEFTTDASIYVYLTHAGGNGVLRMQLEGIELSAPREVLSGIPTAGNHNGGQLAFGPDGMLYVATGDAGVPTDAQDPGSLAGKVLRITPLGAVPEDNPVEGSPVWTLGHRNVQGLGWDAAARMFATEFGQATWDELNLLQAGRNYGWPEVEGDPGSNGADDGDEGGFVRPLVVWAPAEASPSGLAVTDEAVYVAGLRGERLWRVPFDDVGGGGVGARGGDGDGGGSGGDGESSVRLGAPEALLVGEYGRLRTVAVAPDGSLWVVTNNTDGRGSPMDGDDRILRIPVG